MLPVAEIVAGYIEGGLADRRGCDEFGDGFVIKDVRTDTGLGLPIVSVELEDGRLLKVTVQLMEDWT